MSLFAITASTDLTGLGKGKRLAGWSFSATTAAVINLRNGSVAGTPFISVGVAAGDSKTLAYQAPNALPVFVNGLYVEVASGTGIVGSVDLR